MAQPSNNLRKSALICVSINVHLAHFGAYLNFIKQLLFSSNLNFNCHLVYFGIDFIAGTGCFTYIG